MNLTRRATVVILAVLLSLAPVATQSAMADGLAADDAYSVAEDALGGLVVPVEAGVLVNDTGGSLALCVSAFDTTALQGSLADPGVNADGAFTYTPPSNFSGTTTFTYTVATRIAEACPPTSEGSAVVTITVTPVNDPPTAVADSFSALAGHTLNVAAPGVLANDSDIDGDSLTALKVNSPAHGVLTLAADGGFSYSPTSGYSGPDAFSYKASDGAGQSATRIVSLSVSAIPPNPTPTPQPTPTPAPPTASPELSASESPLPSDSGLASPSPFDTGLLPSVSPSPSPVTGPTSGQGGGLPLLAVGALALLIGLLAVAGVFFVRSQRSDGDEAFETGAFEDDEPEG